MVVKNVKVVFLKGIVLFFCTVIFFNKNEVNINEYKGLKLVECLMF